MGNGVRESVPRGDALTRRIAYLLEFPTLNGGERSLLTLLSRLDRARFEPIALAPTAGRVAFALREAGIRHIPFDVHPEGKPPPPRPVLASRVGRILRREGVVLLHANSLSMSFVSGRAADEAGIGAIGHSRDIMRLTRTRIAELSRNRLVVCVSQAAADSLLGQGLRVDLVRVVRNAVDLEVFRPDGPTAGLREELLLPEDAPLVGTIGQICLRKGHAVLLKAFAAVVEKEPEAILVVIGERHSAKPESLEYERDLHRFVERRGLARNVRFLGYRDDVPALLRDLDVYAHAAHQEPLGRVLLEAAATGLPVLATRVGGTAEIVVHGETGTLVPPNRPPRLARALIGLIRDEKRRRDLGLQGRERMRERFGPRDHAAEIADVYEEALNGRG